MRGTGQTTKNIYLALMSDHKQNYLLAPNQDVLRHMTKIFTKSAPKFEKRGTGDFKIGNTYYFFRTVFPNLHEMMFGLSDPAVFPDHSCFDLANSSNMMVYELSVITEIIKQKRDQDGDNSGQIKTEE